MALLTENNRDQWRSGKLFDAYNSLGSHPVKNGVQFRVWAPGAQAVHIVGDFNGWKAGPHELRRPEGSDFWEITIADAARGDCYKYAITGADGTRVLKADPFAFYAQEKSHHASVIYPLPDFTWSDEKWMRSRSGRHQPNRPIAIYEMHPGSWRRDKKGGVMGYRQLANQLVPYVKEMGFTHIELLPILEHPHTPSWGYQITGYFAPTARYGCPDDFMAFVDVCHEHEIGVIMDWVPGHFPKDEHGLHRFDGSPLFEHADPRRSEHPDWGTHNFDFGKPEIHSFLLSSAHFWCEKYHVDGLRVDAVASMLYLDYAKKEGEWLPNIYGGRENLNALVFLQEFNQMIREQFPAVITVAEESTAWQGVTSPVAEGGLGFDFKWNMGWMNDTLHYFSTSPEKRKQESHSITFPRTYAYDEHFILPFSHDEVVHLKKSLWSKMPGWPRQKFMQLRLLFLYMTGYPGKKLLFMGSEIAQKHEWADSETLDWHLLNNAENRSIQQYVKELLAIYRSEPALFATDNTEAAFSWGDLSQHRKGVFSFSRQNNDQKLTFIFNFSDQKREYAHYVSGRPHAYLFFDTCKGKRKPLDEPVPTALPLRAYQGIIIKAG